ncbi:MAG: hypothetical protein ABIQ18_06330 [Umezawaea sp.]
MVRFVSWAFSSRRRAMFFDADGTLKNYVETQFAPVDIGEGKVTVFFDGKFKATKYAHADGTVDDTLRSGNDFSTQSSWWSRFTDCLNSLGVASWVIGAVAATCAIFCVITAGTGCVACALGVAGAYSAELTFCAARADQG